jgi:ketopantoate reductase
MDTSTLERYQKIVSEVIQYYAQFKPSYGEVETEVLILPEQNHYSLIHVGWHKNQRIHGMVIHIDIKDGKIWIQHDGTSPGVALDLVEKGIPHEDIVLAFYPEYVRPLTDFGTG